MPQVLAHLRWPRGAIEPDQIDEGRIAAEFRFGNRGGQRRAAEMMEVVGLTERADHPATWLSHGEKQWLEIGMVIVQQAELLLVDEPVAGMTDEETARTAALLQSVARERAVLVIEHDMEFVRSLARKVTVMHEGRVLCEGSVDEVQQDERVREVYLGRSRSRAAAAHA